MTFDSQINLLYLYGSKTHMPVYYRILPGHIREVKAFKNTLKEIGVKKAVIIVDKGFYSNANVNMLRMDADHTYMQNEQTLRGWMFINHITLQWYQHLYVELKDKGLLSKYSVDDYIKMLSDVKKIKINNRWQFNEVTNQTKRMIEKLGIRIDEYNT